MPSWKTTFSQIRVTYRHFGDSLNPPILHRKELFVPDHHPTRDKFSRLSGQEERAGLLDRTDIGTRHSWNAALQELGYEIRAHRLTRSKTE